MIYSYSKLQDFLKCPCCFHAKHILGYEDIEKSADMEWGSAIHKVIEDYLLEEVDPSAAFPLLWDLVQQTPDLKFGRYNAGILSQIAVSILRKFKTKRKNFGPKMVLETEVKFKLNGIDFSGKIDYMGDYQSVPMVLDFKTSAMKYETNAAELSSQLALYTHAAKDVLDYHAKEAAYLVMVKSTESIQNLVKTEVTNKWLTTRLDEVKMWVDMAEEAKVKNRWPSNRQTCFYCKRRENGLKDIGRIKETA